MWVASGVVRPHLMRYRFAAASPRSVADVWAIMETGSVPAPGAPPRSRQRVTGPPHLRRDSQLPRPPAARYPRRYSKPKGYRRALTWAWPGPDGPARRGALLKT